MSFVEQVILSSTGGTTNTMKKLNVQIVGDDTAIVAHSVIHGLSTGGGGNYVDVKVNPSGTLATSGDIQNIAGNTISVGIGNSGTGTQRVVLASDQPVIPVSATGNIKVNVTGGTISVNGSKINVTGGTIAATQSGTWNIGTLSSITNPVSLTGGGYKMHVTGGTINANGSKINVTGGTVAATQSGTWNINSITNPVTATISGQKINVTGGTITTNVNGNKINVTGGTIAATQSGTWNINSITNPVTSTINGQKVNVTGGTVAATQSGSWQVNGSKVNVTGGTVNATVNGQKINVTGGTITSITNNINVNTHAVTQSGSWQVNGSKINVTGGTIAATQSGSWNVNANGSKINITGGTLTATVNGQKLNITGGTIAATQSGAWNINSITNPVTATVNGQKINVTGGTLTSITNVVHVDDNSGSLTVDGNVRVNITGGTVAATQSGNWSTRLQDGSGNAVTSATRGSERALTVQIVDGSGTQVTTFGGSSSLNGSKINVTGGTITSKLQDGSGTNLTSATRGSQQALSVQIVDASGNQVTTFGGSSSLSGAKINVTGGTINANGSKINITGGTLTSITNPVAVSKFDGWTNLGISGGTIAATQSGTWNINNISGTITLPTNAATSTKQSDGSQKTQIVSASNVPVDTLSDGAVGGLDGLGVSLVATNFVLSTGNTSTAQLASSATFTGIIESVYNQQAISVLLTSDQNGTLVLKQYIDLAGTRLISSWTFSIVAGTPFSRCFTANGNYFNLTFQNNGGGTTTTLNINTAYGTLPAVTNLGFAPTALNEINGSVVINAINALNTTGSGLLATQLVGQFDDVSPQTVTENQFGNLRMSSKGVLYHQIRDAAGNERGANVNASNQLSVSVDNTVTVNTHAVTQSGSWNVNGSKINLTGGTLTSITNVVHVDDNSGSITVDAPVGTPVFVTTTPSTTGGWTMFSTPNNNSNTPLTTTVVTVKGSAGTLGGYFIYNPNSTVAFVQVFDVSGTVTLGTTRPNVMFGIPPLSSANLELVNGLNFANAIKIAATTTSSGSVAPTTGLEVSMWYK